MLFRSITDRHAAYAREVENAMFEQELRVEVDDRSEKIGYKIREAELEKVPYILLVGDKEIESHSVAVRKRGQGDIGTQNAEEFIANLLLEIKEKR